MLNNNLKKIIFILFIVASSFVQADNEYIKELEAGKSVVLIINADESSKSEQYADWSHYLNAFTSDVGNSYVFHKVSTRKLKNIILNSENFREDYSMLFMKKGMPSFFYGGPIVEPQVYQFVKLTYLGKPIKPEYLKQFSPEEVNIEFKKCN